MTTPAENELRQQRQMAAEMVVDDAIADGRVNYRSREWELLPLLGGMERDPVKAAAAQARLAKLPKGTHSAPADPRRWRHTLAKAIDDGRKVLASATEPSSVADVLGSMGAPATSAPQPPMPRVMASGADASQLARINMGSARRTAAARVNASKAPTTADFASLMEAYTSPEAEAMIITFDQPGAADAWADYEFSLSEWERTGGGASS